MSQSPLPKPHSTHGLRPGLAGDRGSDLPPGPWAHHARAPRRGDADGPRPARHFCAAFAARDPLLGAGRRFDRLIALLLLTLGTACRFERRKDKMKRAQGGQTLRFAQEPLVKRPGNFN
jgi:hypothetical protein